MEDDYPTVIAEQLLLETDHLEECPHGEKLSTGDDDLTDVYKLLNGRITSGKISLGGYTRREFSDKIKDVYEYSGEECYTCEKNKRD